VRISVHEWPLISHKTCNTILESLLSLNSMLSSYAQQINGLNATRRILAETLLNSRVPHISAGHFNYYFLNIK
jgi:hypothetical protein